MLHPIHSVRSSESNLAEIWSERAQQHGARCVINLSYVESEFEIVTRRQLAALLPILQMQLNGKEQTVLDFGCGPGRFSAALATAVNGGRVVGFDICKELTDLAPFSSGVQYVSSSTDAFFSSCQERFDVLWICLVLGGIPDDMLPAIAANLTSLVQPNGLLFLAEHMSEDNPGNDFWKFRTLERYLLFFPQFDLRKAGSYLDFGQEVGVLTGRKREDANQDRCSLERLRMAWRSAVSGLVARRRRHT
jgi:2-polyprenyl-3-methyl-5-hydroxy-6-metoxy-1,4-benzoquinol methylase